MKPWLKAMAWLVLAGMVSTATAQGKIWKGRRVKDETGQTTYLLQSPSSVSNSMHMAVLWDDICQPYGILLATRAKVLSSRAREDVVPAYVDFVMQDGTILTTEVAFIDEKIRNWSTLSIYPYPEEIEAIMGDARDRDMIDVAIRGDDESILLEGHVLVMGIGESIHKLKDRCIQDRLAREIE